MTGDLKAIGTAVAEIGRNSTTPYQSSGNSINRSNLKMLQTLMSRTAVFGSWGGNNVAEQVRRIRSERCSEEMAIQAARRLIGCYAERRMMDMETFTASLLRVFMDYPAAVVWSVVDPAYGLPSKLKFFPNIADVACALREFDDHLTKLEGQAKECLAEEVERVRSLAFMRRREPERELTDEERRAVVEKALGKINEGREGGRQVWKPVPPLKYDQARIDHLMQVAENTARPR